MIAGTRYVAVKRAIDLALCAAAAPLVLPLFLACAAAIRLDSRGPVQFTQLRTGRDGTRFKMYKFRTMRRDAEALKPQLAHLNVLPPPDFKILDDPRITRVGRVIRALSLDELPQLINVVRGDMSLVGPRPTSFAAGSYDLWHTVRLEVRPGLTGLWQVQGRNGSTFDERLRLDIEYLNNISLALDVKILARTVMVVLRRSGV